MGRLECIQLRKGLQVHVPFWKSCLCKINQKHEYGSFFSLVRDKVINEFTGHDYLKSCTYMCGSIPYMCLISLTSMEGTISICV